MLKSSFIALVVMVCFSSFCFSSCAAMHAVTGDAMFAPREPKKTAVRGPDVPEAEPDDAHLQEAPKPVTEEDELAPLPPPVSKKKGQKVASASDAP